MSFSPFSALFPASLGRTLCRAGRRRTVEALSRHRPAQDARCGARHRAAKRDVRQTRPIAAGESDIADNQNDEALTVLQMTIDDILGRLPISQRRIVELRIAGFDVAEIAEKTGRARRSVERILQEFRDRLRTQTSAE